jgi:ABC-type multidrug transport system permease subunit
MFTIVTHQADIPGYLEDRLLFNRERSSNVCTVESYWISRAIVDIPFSAFCTIIYCCIVYYMVQFRSPATNFFFFIYILLVTDIVGYYAAQLVANMSPNNFVAMSIFPVSMFFALAFEGFIIYIPQYEDWLKWATYVSYLRYSFQALVLNEFDDNSLLPLSEAYIDELGFNTWSKQNCAIIIWLFVVGHAIAAFLVLKYINYIRR